MDEARLRFDFTHFAALTPEEVAKVEELVNDDILKGAPGSMTEMPLNKAKKLGALAFFGEKYGETVRVVRMGESSVELCGGTHVDNTAKIGLFKILVESSVAAGVRRIEATTGKGVLSLITRERRLLSDAARELKAPPILSKKPPCSRPSCATLCVEALNSKLAMTKLDDILKSAVTIGPVKLVTARFDSMELDVARSLADEIKARNPDTVAVIATNNDNKLNFIAVAGAAAVARGAHAGKLVGSISAITGGKGGGRPDNAMAGGRDASMLNEALASASGALAAMLH